MNKALQDRLKCLAYAANQAQKARSLGEAFLELLAIEEELNNMCRSLQQDYKDKKFSVEALSSFIRSRGRDYVQELAIDSHALHQSANSVRLLAEGKERLDRNMFEHLREEVIKLKINSFAITHSWDTRDDYLMQSKRLVRRMSIRPIDVKGHTGTIQMFV